MCPVCLTTAALIAGGITSSGGLTAIAIKRFGVKPSRRRPEQETVPNSNQRRDQDVNKRD
jgi:hypothetical protein